METPKIAKIIKSSDVPNGHLTDYHVKAVREINLAPTFNRKEKAWHLSRIPKSTTRNVSWLIKCQEAFYLAIQICGPGQTVVFYTTDPKGKSILPANKVKEYPGYVDLETAVDLFYDNEIKPTLNQDANEEQSVFSK